MWAISSSWLTWRLQISPPECEEWRTIADRYRLVRRHSWSIIDGAVTRLLSSGDRSPCELAELEPSALEQLKTSFNDRYDIRDFWMDSRLSVANASEDDSMFWNPQDIDLATFRRATKTQPAGSCGPTSPSVRMLSDPPSGQLRPSGEDGADRRNSSIGSRSVAGGPLCSGSGAGELVETSIRIAPGQFLCAELIQCILRNASL